MLGLIAVGGVGYVAFRQPWASYRLTTDGLPPATVESTGLDAYPVAGALALVILTSGVAVLAAGATVRRIVGLVVVAASVGALVTRAVDSQAVSSALLRAITESPSYAGGPLDLTAGWSWWQAAAWACFLVSAVLGVVTVLAARQWDSLGRRYEAPGAARDDDDLWSAISEGDDPTI